MEREAEARTDLALGVLALQGDFAEHAVALGRLGVSTRLVRLPEHLDGLQGIILPGGESTAIGKLAATYGLIDPLRAFAREHAVWGTCAGAILLSRDAGRDQPLLNLMDITVERNAFGRQVDSFETKILFDLLEDPMRPFPCVFIRAPLIERVGEDVEVLARLDSPARPGGGTIVAARQGRWLATSFHPELTSDLRFHKAFAEIAHG
ncbi:MAG TPA: pyridoxal 5'-phosphate synthase glutaminase subunit PdxT [Anaerolineales bacterium]|nr:pyridoxal 5'-phosphate synthase glutaminase subunit PdxT [Anaerolineales bacterium]